MSASYIIRKGDTLSSIGRRNACDVDALKSQNPGIDPHHLAPGSSLQLPTARNRASSRRPAEAQLNPSHAASSDAPAHGSASAAREWYAIVGDDAQKALFTGVSMWSTLRSPVTRWLREHESIEAVHTTAEQPAQERAAGQRAHPAAHQTAQPASARNAARRHRDEVIKHLHERLYATPHVVQTPGVKLSRNERKMIVAAVGLCEVNNDVFGAENKDQEFVGRKFGKHGIETGYSRIVHIGLSFGYIQYTQDGGEWGRC